ncbi:MAG: hypothetical protein JWQ35_424 [Bacteriovoracaceae bacterium]|nr:hypothetical protein [Bacteriovoracaceae bacterium]
MGIFKGLEKRGSSCQYITMRTLILFCAFTLSSKAFALCVVPPKANLRKGPGLNFSLIMDAIPYTPLKKVSKKGGWYEVKDVDGKSAWVREDVVTTTYKCVVIKDEFANIRNGPGTKFPKSGAGMGEKYLSFRLLEEQKEWVKVEDLDGDQAWIHKPAVWIQ